MDCRASLAMTTPTPYFTNPIKYRPYPFLVNGAASFSNCSVLLHFWLYAISCGQLKRRPRPMISTLTLTLLL
jgi:hypothetical protein